MQKITDADVLAIRAHYVGPAPHKPYAEYGRSLNIGGDTVRRVAIGKLRRGVGGGVVAPDFRPVVERLPMARPHTLRGGRPPRSGAVAEESVKIRLTAEEAERFSAAALAAGFTMPHTKAHPEARGAVGAWLRSLGLDATR